MGAKSLEMRTLQSGQALCRHENSLRQNPEVTVNERSRYGGHEPAGIVSLWNLNQTQHQFPLKLPEAQVGFECHQTIHC